MSGIKLNKEYINWLDEIKSKVRSVQVKAAVAANATLIDFYFALGEMITEKETKWGQKLLETVSSDLQQEFPEMKGFSITNLKYCRLFFNYPPIRPQPGDEFNSGKTNELFSKIRCLPWGHIKHLIGKTEFLSLCC